MTDPISDFLTHLRNASKAGLAVCVSPHSKLKESLANILKNEGYVRDVATGTDERGHERPRQPAGDPAGSARQDAQAAQLGIRRRDVPRQVGRLARQVGPHPQPQLTDPSSS